MQTNYIIACVLQRIKDEAFSYLDSCLKEIELFEEDLINKLK